MVYIISFVANIQNWIPKIFEYLFLRKQYLISSTYNNPKAQLLDENMIKNILSQEILFFYLLNKEIIISLFNFCILKEIDLYLNFCFRLEITKSKIPYILKLIFVINLLSRLRKGIYSLFVILYNKRE